MGGTQNSHTSSTKLDCSDKKLQKTMLKTTKKRVKKEKDTSLKAKKNVNSIAKPKKVVKTNEKKDNKGKVVDQGADVPSLKQVKTMEVPKTKELNVDKH